MTRRLGRVILLTLAAVLLLTVAIGIFLVPPAKEKGRYGPPKPMVARGDADLPAAPSALTPETPVALGLVATGVTLGLSVLALLVGLVARQAATAKQAEINEADVRELRARMDRHLEQ